ncbi:hypothetical protein HAX54_024307 [Datura stramonium]|uniref:DUF7866 domain-containing protein n=1 Tax=Datura stramonium TaxID=4076 RepID=A0ABS8UZU9_DATST|nr:hypothetical protein [Datura stramonium]
MVSLSTAGATMPAPAISTLAAIISPSQVEKESQHMTMIGNSLYEDREGLKMVKTRKQGARKGKKESRKRKFLPREVNGLDEEQDGAGIEVHIGKSSVQNLAKLSSLPVILVLLFYCLVMVVTATGSHVTNHGIDLDDDDDKKPNETSLAVSGKRLEPLYSATEYRLVTASHQGLEMELAAGHNKSKTWLWSQQQQPFQLCLACKCCMSAAGEAEPSTCTSMPCCFVIDCQLPNKPFGVCAFVPKTCNCTSCATPLL